MQRASCNIQYRPGTRYNPNACVTRSHDRERFHTRRWTRLHATAFAWGGERNCTWLRMRSHEEANKIARGRERVRTRRRTRTHPHSTLSARVRVCTLLLHVEIANFVEYRDHLARTAPRTFAILWGGRGMYCHVQASWSSKVLIL